MDASTAPDNDEYGTIGSGIDDDDDAIDGDGADEDAYGSNGA